MGSTKKAERPTKRNLVRWNDDLDKQVMLTVQYACNEAGVRIPWDDVARLMCEITGEPKFTGGAIIQHLSKLRTKMESQALKVPPSLKRGIIVNTPSKVYAAGNKRKLKSSTAKTLKSSTVKPKKSKARKLKSEDEDEDDPEITPVLYDDYDDDEEDSDGEYGSAKKKRRVSSEKARGKKQSAVATEKEDDEEGFKTPRSETPTIKADVIKRGSLKAEADIKESIESQSPLPRTRGVKHNYAKTDTGSDENGDEEDDAQDEEEVEEEEFVKEDIKSDGEISPRTKVGTFVANESGFVNLASDLTQGYPDVGFGLDLGPAYHFGQPLGQHQPFQTQQYQIPAHIGLDFPQSTGSSFSTNRTGSMASTTSAMAPSYSEYVNPVSYAPMINSDTATHDFSNEDIMYGDQYIPPITYSSSNFLSSFNDPFSGTQDHDGKGDYL